MMIVVVSANSSVDKALHATYYVTAHVYYGLADYIGTISMGCYQVEKRNLCYQGDGYERHCLLVYDAAHYITLYQYFGEKCCLRIHG